ncbi:MAG TPA: YggT family protein [bacterium]|jgi:YggT family protein
MYVLGYLLRAVAGILHFVLQLGIILFLVRAVLSWFQPDTRQPVIAFIYSVTDPVLNSIRRLIPPLGMVDLSPFFAIAALWFVDNFLVPVLHRLAAGML